VVALPGRAPDTQKSSEPPWNRRPLERHCENGSVLAAGLDAVAARQELSTPSISVTGARAAYDMIVTAFAQATAVN